MSFEGMGSSYSVREAPTREIRYNVRAGTPPRGRVRDIGQSSGWNRPVTPPHDMRDYSIRSMSGYTTPVAPRVVPEIQEPTNHPVMRQMNYGTSNAKVSQAADVADSEEKEPERGYLQKLYDMYDEFMEYMDYLWFHKTKQEEAEAAEAAEAAAEMAAAEAEEAQENQKSSPLINLILWARS
jgi:hypothetical protein